MALFSLFLREEVSSGALSESELRPIVELTEGFSGADIHIVCKEAAMRPMRRLLDTMDTEQLLQQRQKGQLLVPKVCENV
jgi:SpoVK/Ycf46/Vps4 family AAA+-type ATPase